MELTDGVSDSMAKQVDHTEHEAHLADFMRDYDYDDDDAYDPESSDEEDTYQPGVMQKVLLPKALTRQDGANSSIRCRVASFSATSPWPSRATTEGSGLASLPWMRKAEGRDSAFSV